MFNALSHHIPTSLLYFKLSIHCQKNNVRYRIYCLTFWTPSTLCWFWHISFRFCLCYWVTQCAAITRFKRLTMILNVCLADIRPKVIAARHKAAKQSWLVGTTDFSKYFKQCTTLCLVLNSAPQCNSQFISIIYEHSKGMNFKKPFLLMVKGCFYSAAHNKAFGHKARGYCVGIAGGDKWRGQLWQGGHNAGHWVDTRSGRTLVMRRTPKWLGEKIRSKITYFTGKNCLNSIVLFVFLCWRLKFSKMLNSFFFTASHEFCPSRSFLRIVFEPLWKLFKLPNICLSFFLSKHSPSRFSKQILCSKFPLNFFSCPCLGISKMFKIS